MADGQFLVDQSGGQVAFNPRRRVLPGQSTDSAVASAVNAQTAAVVNLINQVQAAQFNREMRMASGLEEAMDSPSGFSPMLASFDTNTLWLEITNVANGLSYLNLHNATNEVYAIWSTTNLATPLAGWQVEMELWPTDTNCMPFTVATLARQSLFFRAEDWTGVDSDGDGIPDSWIWMYFGNLSETATNLDADGNTLLYDYTNNFAPATFQFLSIEVTNNYVSSMSAPTELNVTGNPYYIAISVDDTNYAADATWNAYASSNVVANLGLTEGWHDVWIGLRGHADDPSAAVWWYKRLKLDFTPPLLVVTNPVVSTVSVPMIQVQGYCPENLAGISFDLSNAVAVVTNQFVSIHDRYYDTNTFELTTNIFQCFDIPLTNGVNTITLHATDMAGNVTTTNLNFTLDYSSRTNPPAVQLFWPQNGEQISGTNFTWRGWVDDPTAAVTAQIVSTNGTTNTVYGLVERNGNFWAENLPMPDGTNSLTLTVTDSAGNTAVTNITVSTNPLTVTMTPIPDDQLWNKTVTATGTISDSTYSLWINGIKAVVSSGTWTANNVPMTDGGTAVFNVTTYAPGETQPDGSHGN